MEHRQIEQALAEAGFFDPQVEAALLIDASRGNDDVLADLVARRLEGEPIEWLTGSVSFLRHDIRIDRGVYVPRPQSELIAARAIERLPADGLALDLATGCGAIAVVLSAARTGATVMATEIDLDSCRCAVANGVDVLVGDLGAPVPERLHGRFDVVVGVVPYVPTEEMEFLPRDVRRYEPRLALDGGPGGLGFLARAVRWGSVLLRAGGSLVLELGGSQDSGLRPVLNSAGFELVDRLRDGDGDLRGVEAIRKG